MLLMLLMLNFRTHQPVELQALCCTTLRAISAAKRAQAHTSHPLFMCMQVMLRYIDSGDDVGCALSPQLMYNVIPDCDIFNHQNVHFWEMMQPGMDAVRSCCQLRCMLT